jgi:hypothetical protein
MEPKKLGRLAKYADAGRREQAACRRWLLQWLFRAYEIRYALSPGGDPSMS